MKKNLIILICAASTVIISCDNSNKRSGNGIQNENMPTTNPHNLPMADSTAGSSDLEMSSNKRSGDMAGIFSQLNLTDEQETQLEALEEKYDSRTNASNDQTASDNQTAMTEMEQEIKGILTSAQFEKYQQIKNDSIR